MGFQIHKPIFRPKAAHEKNLDVNDWFATKIGCFSSHNQWCQTWLIKDITSSSKLPCSYLKKGEMWVVLLWRQGCKSFQKQHLLYLHIHTLPRSWTLHLSSTPSFLSFPSHASVPLWLKNSKIQLGMCCWKASNLCLQIRFQINKSHQGTVFTGSVWTV